MLLELHNIYFKYPDGTQVLQNLDFAIDFGESVGIIGISGSGKSTFVHHLNGIHLPIKNGLHLKNVPISQKNLPELRKAVGLLFQNPDDQLFCPRVYDDVAFGPENLAWPTEIRQQKIEIILKRLGIWDLREKMPPHLSQGQKRKAALAAVLVCEPELLVLDEPSSDLDPGNRIQLIQILRELAIAKIIVSHDLDLIWDCCQTTLLLHQGHFVAKGPSHEILSDRELLESHGLALPLRLQSY